MLHRPLFSICILLLATIASASARAHSADDLVGCSPGLAIAHANGEEAAHICGASTVATELLCQCGLRISQRVRIEVVRGDLVSSGIRVHGASYPHLGLIKLASLEDARALQARQPFYAKLSSESFYRGIVIHELAHLAFAEVETATALPYGAHEYVAAVFQVASYSDEEREAFTANVPPGRPSTAIFSAMLATLHPELFAAAAYKHFSLHGCSILQGLVRGTVVFPPETEE